MTEDYQRPLVLFTASSGWAIRNVFHTGLASQVAVFADVGVAASLPLLHFFEHLRDSGEVSEVVALPAEEKATKRVARQTKKAVLQASQNIGTARMQWQRRGGSEFSRALRGGVWAAGRACAAGWQIPVLEKIEDLLPAAELSAISRPPTLLVNSSPFSFADNEMQRQLGRLGVPAIAVIPSWDNPSSKGCFLGSSERVLVWGENQKEEIARFYPRLPLDRIVVAGIPQFDSYTGSPPRNFDRETFLSSLSIDPSSQVILYGTGNPRNQPGEPMVVQTIARALRGGRFGANAHLLVRCHPADDLIRYASLVRDGCTTLFPPSTAFSDSTPSASPPNIHPLLTWIPPLDETSTLAAMIRHCDVSINIASTMTLDSLACGTPVINVRYDGDRPRPYLDSVRRFYDQEHYLPISRSGVVPLVDSPEELLIQIAKALVGPRSLSDGQRQLIGRICFQPGSGSIPLIVGEIERMTSGR